MSGSGVAAETGHAQDLALPARRRRTIVPTVIQMEAVECGAAALAMILAHFGRWVPLRTLREQCMVGRDGANALQVAKVARTYGLTAKGVRKEVHELSDLATPFVAFWGFNHFVVVEGWDSKGMWLNDPAVGHRRAEWDEVDRSFTGIAITFSPKPEFERKGSRPSVTAALRSHIAGTWSAVIYCVVLGIILSVPAIAGAIALALFVNRFLIYHEPRLLLALFTALALCLAAQFSLGWMQRKMLTRISIAVSVTLTTRLVWHLLRLPTRFYSQRFPAEIAWRLSLTTQIAALLAGPLPQTLISLVTVACYFAAIALIDISVAAATAVFAALNVVALIAVSRRRREGNQLAMQFSGKLFATATAGLQNIETIKASGAEPDLFARFTGQHAQLVTARQRVGGPSQLLAALPGFLSLLAITAAIGLGGYAVLSGELSVGSLLALQLLVAGAIAPFSSLVALGSAMQDVGSALAKVDDVLDTEPDAEPAAAAQRPALVSARTAPAPHRKLHGSIEFRDVVFGYNRNQPPLLRGLSFTVPAGTRLAIVGTSGAGKSTVSKLLTGLEQPWSGQILLDGVAREDLDPGVITASLALVDQNIFLFTGTVTDNISLWDPSISPEKIVAAARDAEIHATIAARTAGYDSSISNGGRNFSGGEAQRIEIARALAADPTMLVLDEATSALDASTEVRIDRNIRRRGCTTVVVAHRLSTIRDSEHILVLDKGRVVQSGTHDQLMAEGGLYQRLIES